MSWLSRAIRKVTGAAQAVERPLLDIASLRLDRLGGDLTKAWHNPLARGAGLAAATYFTGGAAGLGATGAATAAGAAGGAGYYSARGKDPWTGALVGGGLGYGVGAATTPAAAAGTTTAGGASIAPTTSGATLGGGTNLGAGTVYGGAGAGEGAVVSGAGAGTAPSAVSTALASTPSFASKYAVPLTALGASLLLGRSKTPELNNLQDIAGPAKDVGTQYLNAVKSGQLPSGYQEQFDTYLRTQTASVKQQYAGMGMSGSTQEAEALKRVQDNSQIVRSQLMGNVLSQGLQSLNLAVGPYTNIANVQLSQDQQAQQALSTFAMTYGLMQAGMGR